ncbi:unnamed protein product [Gongylonema pulchrum]|uniref:Uncharacterized protein n=1 Tax=Gongylonema pulchrum TaxID=637853 RepID=A0A3P6QBQ4_9BILA|nr:unnamed protein product [Gongylonema pulchrum]
MPYGDARPFKTYIQGALDILTGRANMDYRQLSTFYFGNKRFLLRHTVDLAEYRSHPAQPYWKREIAQRFAEKCAEQDSRFLHSNEQDPFFPAFQEMLPSFRRLGTCLDAPDPIHHIHGTTVAIRGPLRFCRRTFEGSVKGLVKDLPWEETCLTVLEMKQEKDNSLLHMLRRSFHMFLFNENKFVNAGLQTGYTKTIN